MRRRGRGVAAAALLLAACSPGDVVDTTAPVPTVPNEVVVTPVPTTVAPTAQPIDVPPTPVTLPTTEPTAAPTAAPAEPQVTAEPTVAPTVAPEPAIASDQAPAPTAAPPPPATPVPASSSQEVLVANGGEVFTLNCARCHAETGFGTAQYSGLIGVGSKYSTASMIAELTTGHPVTFGFADRLSTEEIASVVAYVKAAFP